MYSESFHHIQPVLGLKSNLQVDTPAEAEVTLLLSGIMIDSYINKSLLCPDSSITSSSIRPYTNWAEHTNERGALKLWNIKVNHVSQQHGQYF